MRKTFVTAFVALLAILAVSCDEFLDVPGSKPEYTADGRPAVTLNIITSGALGNSRSLSNTNAKETGVADFVEVIFKSGTNFYRATGWFGASLPITILEADYAVGDAVMFIGKKNSDTDYTLLAVGHLAAALNLKTGSKPTGNKVAFTVTSSLTAPLNADATLPAFAITEGTISTETGWETAGVSKKGKIGAQPSFQVPKKSGIGATLTIGGFPTGITAFTFAGQTATLKLISALTTTIAATPGAASLSSGNCMFSFSFDTSSATGDAYIITFEIPVSFSTDSSGLGWKIRGGTISDVADSTGSRAEGILLAVLTAPNPVYFDGTVDPVTLP